MKKEQEVWKIDHVYRDMGVKNKNEGYPPEDEFAARVSIDRAQRWGIANSGGIRKLSSGDGKKKNNKLPPAAVFLITNTSSTAFHNPWEDTIDYATGTVTCWGDAKYKKGKGVDDWDGNVILREIHENVLEGKFNEHPPILYFIKEKLGLITFKGVCVIENMDKTWFMDQDKRVVNYRFKLAVLDIENVAMQWLLERAKNENMDPDTDAVPNVWKKYKKTGIKSRLLSWNTKIRTKEQQQPAPSSLGDLLLTELEEINPFDFERIICHLLKSYKTIVHKVIKTRYVRDGGFDMEGEFILPDPFKYPIKFKGEVKRHKSGIGPKDVSRLVARLGRGEYGLFFTTSYFTSDAQKEVILDNYPVRLISGADLYDYFYEAKNA